MIGGTRVKHRLCDRAVPGRNYRKHKAHDYIMTTTDTHGKRKVVKYHCSGAK